MTKTPQTILVHRRSVSARVERALGKQGRELHADRRNNEVNLYIIDTEKQAIVETEVDLEKLAREIRVLRPWEEITEEPALFAQKTLWKNTPSKKSK
jgi:hypothetical protein